MREIKFRGKREDNGEWVLGSLIKCGITGKHYIFPIGSDANESDKTGEEGCLKLVTFEVNNETVGQYTGLKDKDGNKVYEGDILMGRGSKQDLAQVCFGKFFVIDVDSLEKIDEVHGWYTKVIPTDALSKIEPFCLDMPLADFYIDRAGYEVIGNIYENPKLLQEVDECNR